MAYLKVLILVLLSVPQAFMPLLHAHVGGDGSPAVLHLPGLERYYHTDEPGIYRNAPLPSWEEAIVRSDDGVRRELVVAPPLAAVLPPPLPSMIGPSPSPPQQAPPSAPQLRFCLNLLLPRAPPV